jgi:hypothetical protein
MSGLPRPTSNVEAAACMQRVPLRAVHFKAASQVKTGPLLSFRSWLFTTVISRKIVTGYALDQLLLDALPQCCYHRLSDFESRNHLMVVSGGPIRVGGPSSVCFALFRDRQRAFGSHLRVGLTCYYFLVRTLCSDKCFALALPATSI